MSETRLKAIVATNVKALRESRGLSQEKLAEAVGRTWQTISLIERGKSLPPLGTLSDMAAALGVPVVGLLSQNFLFPSERREGLTAQAEALFADFNDDQLEVAVKMLTLLREGFGRG